MHKSYRCYLLICQRNLSLYRIGPIETEKTGSRSEVEEEVILQKESDWKQKKSYDNRTVFEIIAEVSY
jgi:hypothetical protein